MINDKNIRRMEREPAKITEGSYRERALKIADKSVDVKKFTKEFGSTFEELAVRYYPAPTVAESVAIAMQKLKEDLASAPKPRRPRWVIS